LRQQLNALQGWVENAKFSEQERLVYELGMKTGNDTKAIAHELGTSSGHVGVVRKRYRARHTSRVSCSRPCTSSKPCRSGGRAAPLPWQGWTWMGWRPTEGDLRPLRARLICIRSSALRCSRTVACSVCKELRYATLLCRVRSTRLRAPLWRLAGIGVSAACRAGCPRRPLHNQPCSA
jgi:hypothetical protein